MTADWTEDDDRSVRDRAAGVIADFLIEGDLPSVQEAIIRNVLKSVILAERARTAAQLTAHRRGLVALASAAGVTLGPLDQNGCARALLEWIGAARDDRRRMAVVVEAAREVVKLRYQGEGEGMLSPSFGEAIAMLAAALKEIP